MEKAIRLYIPNFFLFIVIIRIAAIMGISFNLMRIFQLVGLILGVFCMMKVKYHAFDRLIVGYLFYIVINILFTSYQYQSEFLYYAFLAQIIPILFYYIGRKTNVSAIDVLDAMKWPLVFALICGLYFFFNPPTWYIEMKNEQVHAGSTDFSILGIFRLSSFWGHPYQIGYATCLYFFYLLYTRINFSQNKREKIVNSVLIALCAVCLLLAQLRVTIAVSIIVMFYLTYVINKERLSVVMKYSVISVLMLVIGVVALLSSDSEISSYIVEHTTVLLEKDEINNRFEHTAGGIVHNSLFGDGFGRYGFLAREHNGWAIVDHEFQRHLAELGYIGIFFLGAILFFTLLKGGLKKELAVETSVLIFYMIAMLGASVLSNEHQYNFIFWFCVGKIWSNTNVKIG